MPTLFFKSCFYCKFENLNFELATRVDNCTLEDLSVDTAAEPDWADGSTEVTAEEPVWAAALTEVTAEEPDWAAAATEVKAEEPDWAAASTEVTAAEPDGPDGSTGSQLSLCWCGYGGEGEL